MVVGDDATRKMSRRIVDTVKVELLSRMVTVLKTGARSLRKLVDDL